MEAVTLVKICGITNLKDALAADLAGADSLGFVCDRDSPRYINPQTFCLIDDALPEHIKRVAVFDKEPSEEWTSCDRSVIERFNRIQFSSDSIWSDVIGCNWDMRKKIKSFSITCAADLLALSSYNGLVQSYLINVHVQSSARRRDPDAYGWTLAHQVHQFGKRLYLAGGLRPENVARAIRLVRPYYVDVNVGVESEPGIKDSIKMRDFVQAVNNA